MILKKCFLVIVLMLIAVQLFAQDTTVVNDITQLNPIIVAKIIKPTSENQIIEAVKNNNGTISIGGGRFSMGGQIAIENSLHLDMRSYNNVITFSPLQKTITVQSGITWRKIQEYIDSFNLSIEVMQTYSNFTVGGSISVNAHGRYLAPSTVGSSVQKIKLILANGNIIETSPTYKSNIFNGIVGGYGGLGVISEVTLKLTENTKIQRLDKKVLIKDYNSYFTNNIQKDSLIVFYNADIYPKKYKKIRAVSYVETNKEITIKERLKPLNKKYKLNKMVLKIVSNPFLGKWVRQHIIDPIVYIGKPVEWRNYEASYNVEELEPRSRKRTTYVLQEYFAPVSKFDSIFPKMIKVLKDNNVNVVNISIRYASKDTNTILSWAKDDVHSFVIYYKQKTTKEAINSVQKWTSQLIDIFVAQNGTFYLPYQILATKEQFSKAYPKADQYFKLKKELDPTYKFNNKLWEAYYK